MSSLDSATMEEALLTEPIFVLKSTRNLTFSLSGLLSVKLSQELFYPDFL